MCVRALACACAYADVRGCERTSADTAISSDENDPTNENCVHQQSLQDAIAEGPSAMLVSSQTLCLFSEAMFA